MGTLLRSVGRRVKRAVTQKILEQAVNLYARCSDETLKKVWRLMERMATDPGTKFEARKMRYLIDSGHPGGQWLKRIARQLNPKAAKTFLRNVYGNAWFLATDKRNEFRQRHGFLPPWLMVFDMTMRCNLRCRGCWAGSYKAGERPELPYDVLMRMLKEARDEMGVHFFVVTGGEPFVREDSWDVYRELSDCQFHIYTNATLVDDEAVKKLVDLGNCMLMISIEGGEETTDARRGKGVHAKGIAAMDRLRRAGVPFGFSCTPMRDTWDKMMTEEFVSEMVERGCIYGWLFQYIPIGRDPDPDLMVPPEGRDEMRRRLYKFREKYPIYLVDFWNDGPEVGGCLAGGRMFLHVSANGDIEPCVFAHCATHNIKESTLTDALLSPLFTKIRDGIPYEGNFLRPCMIIDRPDVLRRLWRECGAHPTHPGADVVLDEKVAAKLDKYAAGVKRIFDPVWESGDVRRIFPEPPPGYF